MTETFDLREGRKVLLYANITNFQLCNNQTKCGRYTLSDLTGKSGNYFLSNEIRF